MEEWLPSIVRMGRAQVATTCDQQPILIAFAKPCAPVRKTAGLHPWLQVQAAWYKYILHSPACCAATSLGNAACYVSRPGRRPCIMLYRVVQLRPPGKQRCGSRDWAPAYSLNPPDTFWTATDFFFPLFHYCLVFSFFSSPSHPLIRTLTAVVPRFLRRQLHCVPPGTPSSVYHIPSRRSAYIVVRRLGPFMETLGLPMTS